MPDDALRIVSQFDIGAITAGMEESATAVKAGTGLMNDSFSSLAAAQIRVSSANKDLRDTLSSVVSKGLTPTTAATQEVAAAMFEAKIATDAFKTAQEEAYGASQRMTGGVNNSRIAFTGLTQDIGIRGSRALGSFLAQSSAIGPILQAAFPVVAAIAFFEILDTGYHKLLDATAALAGWNKEAQAMYARLVQLNQEQVTFNEKLDIEKLALNEVGLKGAALDSQKQVDLLRERTLVQKAFIDSLAREKELKGEIAAENLNLKIPIPGNIPGLGGLPIPAPGQGPDKERVAQLNKQLDEAMAKTQALQHELATLNEVKIPKEKKETGARELDEAQKFHDEMVKFGLELARQDEAELRRMEHLAAEKERLDEEMAKSTEEMAGKDLAAFERSMVDRVRLQEEAGKNELEQIRFNLEQRQKLFAATQTKGEGGEHMTAAAAAAYDQEATKITQLIVLEEQLRAKFIAANNAETDPKVEESLRRQQQLTQQLNIAWQKYQTVVTNVAVKEETDFRKSFDTISNEFNKNFISWMSHTESFGRAMQKVWDGLATSAINSMLRIAEQELIGMALHKTIADQQKLDDAKAAARGAFKWVMEDVPFPINVALAPAAAAAAFAGVMAFERGGVMGSSEGLALLHPNEMVLPSQISQSVQQMAAGGGSSSSSTQMHVHFHGGQAKQDHAGMEDQLVAMVKRAQRRGRIGA